MRSKVTSTKSSWRASRAPGAGFGGLVVAGRSPDPAGGEHEPEHGRQRHAGQGSSRLPSPDASGTGRCGCHDGGVTGAGEGGHRRRGYGRRLARGGSGCRGPRCAPGRRRDPTPSRGPRIPASIPSCWRPATGATWPTATATGATTRSSPSSTPAGTRSTSPSRTGSTTSTSGPSIRTANAFNAAGVHIVGRRRYNRRGAMVTDRYLHVQPPPRSRATCSPGPTESDLPVVGGRHRAGRGAARDRRAARAVRAALRSGRAGAHRGGLRRRRPWCARSPSTGRPDRSTPAWRQASPCTPGSGSTRASRRWADGSAVVGQPSSSARTVRSTTRRACSTEAPRVRRASQAGQDRARSRAASRSAASARDPPGELGGEDLRHLVVRRPR